MYKVSKLADCVNFILEGIQKNCIFDGQFQQFIMKSEGCLLILSFFISDFMTILI